MLSIGYGIIPSPLLNIFPLFVSILVCILKPLLSSFCYQLFYGMSKNYVSRMTLASYYDLIYKITLSHLNAFKHLCRNLSSNYLLFFFLKILRFYNLGGLTWSWGLKLLFNFFYLYKFRWFSWLTMNLLNLFLNILK